MTTALAAAPSNFNFKVNLVSLPEAGEPPAVGVATRRVRSLSRINVKAPVLFDVKI